MKHKHYEMIVAKAADKRLVLFRKAPTSSKWTELHENSLPDAESSNYFLCLPQHKETCLHWLNGGESQYLSNGMERWINFGDSTRWSPTHLFMTNECELRIKPKKEKRWIGVFKDGDLLKNTELSYKTKEQVMGDSYAPKGFDHWQFIEIEVEV